MSEAQNQGDWTPGPWLAAGVQTGTIGYNAHRHIYARAKGGTGVIALVSSSDANAHLMAAAPNLAELVAMMVPYVDAAADYKAPNRARDVALMARAMLVRIGSPI
jgi:hypothetical protein